jgi:hypothetical protein
MKRIIYTHTILFFLFLTIRESLAIGLTFYNSEKTKKTSSLLTYGSPLGRTDFNLPFNLSVSPKFSYLINSYSDIVGITSNQEVSSNFFNIAVDVSYNIKIIELNTKFGDFKPTLSPYLGYEHYWNEVKSNTITSWANSGGISYGIRLYSSLPLNFNAQIGGGATSLFNGITIPIVEGKIGWNPLFGLNISLHTGLTGFPDFHQVKGTAMSSFFGFNAGFGIL